MCFANVQMGYVKVKFKIKSKITSNEKIKWENKPNYDGVGKT